MMRQEFSFNKSLKVLWRFKWIVALVVLVAAGTAWGFTAGQPAVYEARAAVMVESGQLSPSASSTGPASGLQYSLYQGIGSQLQMIQSRNVPEQVVAKLEPQKAKDPEYLQLEANKLSGSLSVWQEGDTNLVVVAVTSSDPVMAQKQADAVAEVYVNEFGQARVAAIKAALENTTTQLKELNATEVDLSISPLLTTVTAKIDTALAALKAADEHLQKVEIQQVAESPVEAVPVVLATISQQVDIATNEAKDLSALSQQLTTLPMEAVFEDHSLGIAIFETQTRSLSAKLGILSSEVNTLQRGEIDPQVQGQLLTVKEQLQVASTSTGAVLDQVLALYSVEERLRSAAAAEGSTQEIAMQEEAGAKLLQRIVQHISLMTANLEAASAQLQEIQPNVSSFSQWKIQNLVEIMREKLSGGPDSVIAVLDGISEELQPATPGQDILLTHGELAAIQNDTRTAEITVAFLLSELGDSQLNELNSQVYRELFGVRESIRIANAAVQGLTDQIAGLEGRGGDSLSLTALDNLRQQLQIQLLTSGSGSARVMGSAVVSSIATSAFANLRSVILAILAGLLLSIFGAILFQYFDRTVRDESQAASYTGLPLLAQVARVKASGNPHPLSVLTEQMFQCLEAFRLMRVNLGLDFSQGQVLLVSSPGEREGKTTIAANLARVVALEGRRVLLIDGSLRKPGIAAAFGLTEGEGLSGFLKGEKEEPWDYITQAEEIDILTSGAASVTSAEMLASPRMKALLKSAREIYDVIIVDSAPLMGCADTRILARDVDVVLLVFQIDASKLDLAMESKQVLETMGVRVAGFVLNKVDPKECKYLPPTYTDKEPQHGVDEEEPADLDGVAT